MTLISGWLAPLSIVRTAPPLLVSVQLLLAVVLSRKRSWPIEREESSVTIRSAVMLIVEKSAIERAPSATPLSQLLALLQVPLLSWTHVPLPANNGFVNSVLTINTALANKIALQNARPERTRLWFIRSLMWSK